MGSKSTIRLVSLSCLLVVFSFMHFSSRVLSQTSQSETCNGSIAECNQEDELLMESEISRRFLEERYISKGALERDKPVCDGGASGEAYSKSEGCLPPPSNPPNRGCSKYYRCRFTYNLSAVDHISWEL
ncbi:Protein RALF-like 32, partial [Mucuna pruriens]